MSNEADNTGGVLITTPYMSYRLPERGTGRCRTSPYSPERRERNADKQWRNKQNRRARAESLTGGRGSK